MRREEQNKKRLMSEKGRLAHALRRVLKGAAGIPGEPPPMRGGAGERKGRRGRGEREGKFIPVIPAVQRESYHFALYSFFIDHSYTVICIVVVIVVSCLRELPRTENRETNSLKVYI